MPAADDNTLDELWKSLGLDSLPADAGSAENLQQTRLRDWEEATLRAPNQSPDERSDLPQLSLRPPLLNGDLPVAERELVVTGLLGEGGMGRVLLAHQSSLGRDVAVKVPSSDGAVRALLHEAQTGGGLEHPGIIPVYSLCTAEGSRPALVMKRVDGVVWTMLIRNPSDPAWERLSQAGSDRLDVHLEILRQVCNAIAFAHRKGVLHRDLKPSNVLIGEFGEVYVADWGIAIRKDQRSNRRPSLVGSPAYLAPEMVTGDDSRMDERTDVFLLGATLYEVLSGSPPWWAPDLRALLEVVNRGEVKPLPASVPPELAQICQRAMRRERADRFASALEFRDAISGYLRHKGSVQLARATEERLLTLEATLQSTAPERVYPLLSECRFGFQQALREWPENDVAREGLRRCLESTARFELERGNVQAARALVAELASVTPELAEALAKAEAEEQRRTEERARAEHLQRQFDVRVSSRERVAMFALTTLTVLALTLFPLFLPEQYARLSASRWYLSQLLVIISAVFGLGLIFGRRALLSTALNRRMMGIIGFTVIGVLTQRVTAALGDVPNRQVLLQNSALVLSLCLTGGVAIHRGFFMAAVPTLIGIVTLLLTRGHDSMIFGLSVVGAMVIIVVSWSERAREAEAGSPQPK